MAFSILGQLQSIAAKAKAGVQSAKQGIASLASTMANQAKSAVGGVVSGIKTIPSAAKTITTLPPKPKNLEFPIAPPKVTPKLPLKIPIAQPKPLVPPNAIQPGVELGLPGIKRTVILPDNIVNRGVKSLLGSSLFQTPGERAVKTEAMLKAKGVSPEIAQRVTGLNENIQQPLNRVAPNSKRDAGLTSDQKSALGSFNAQQTIGAAADVASIGPSGDDLVRLLGKKSLVDAEKMAGKLIANKEKALGRALVPDEIEIANKTAVDHIKSEALRKQEDKLFLEHAATTGEHGEVAAAYKKAVEAKESAALTKEARIFPNEEQEIGYQAFKAAAQRNKNLVNMDVDQLRKAMPGFERVEGKFFTGTVDGQTDANLLDAFKARLAKEKITPQIDNSLIRKVEASQGKMEKINQKMAPLESGLDNTQALIPETSARSLGDEFPLKPKVVTPEPRQPKFVTHDQTKIFDKDGLVKQEFRLDKLNIPEEQMAQIEARLSALGMETRKVRSFGEMQEAALELGADPRALLREVQSGRITDGEVVALREMISSNSDFIAKSQKELIENPGQAALLENKIQAAQAMMDQALKKLVKGGTEAGRAVASFRILANKTMEPVFWFEQAKKMLGDKEFSNEIRAAILDLIGKSDKIGLANFIAMLRKPSFLEKAITLWKAGLLTSPTTHMANIGGNTTMQALLSVADIPSTGVDMLVSLVTGKRTTLVSPRLIMARARGAVKGMKDAAEILKTGNLSSRLLETYGLPRKTSFGDGKVGKILQGYTDTVFNSLGAEDAIFRKAALEESLEKQALVMAKNEKLTGQAAKDRVRDLLLEPTNAMQLEAIDAAEYATFQGDSKVTNAILAGKSRLGEVGKAAVEIVVPFKKTPANVAGAIADFSPAGFIKTIVRQINPETRGQKALVQDLGRALTGTGVMTLGGLLASKGMITGNAPESASDRATFYATGKQPNSIKIGNRWYQLNRIAPIGNLLGLGAEFERQSKEKSGASLASGMTFAGIKGLTQQTFLQGASRALDAVNNPDRSGASYAESTLSGLVPSVVGRIAKTIDPTERVHEGVLQAIQAKIPGLKNSLPAKRDIFGEVVKVGGGAANLIDPFNSSSVNDSPVTDAAWDAGVSIGMPSSTISGEKLSGAEFSTYQKVQGRMLKKGLEQLIADPAYTSLPANSVEKTRAFEKRIRDVRDAINDQVFPALMIKKYNLPPTTPPKELRDLLNNLNKMDDFKQADDKKKARVLQKLLSSAQ